MNELLWGSMRAQIQPDGSLHILARRAGPRTKKHALVVLTPAAKRQLAKYLIAEALAEPTAK